MSKKVIPPVKPYFPPDDIQEILTHTERILRSGMLTLGTYTKNFEIEYARICGVEHAIAVNSGTSALEIALRAIGLKDGDEVLVPTNTFSATVAAVFFAGGRPVLTDVDQESLCINVDNVQRYLTKKTKGVIAVHIGGLICPEIIEIRKICRDLDLFLVEDAAHAHGSTIDGIPAGSLGDAGCFSFYPTKVITTGEGGMITTNHAAIAEKARVLRDQGKESFHSNRIVELGYNWRMNEISAAIGLVQLKRLPEIIQKRNDVAKQYNQKLSYGIEPQKIPSNIVSNYYKYVAFLQGTEREKFKQKMREHGVCCGGEVYWPPCHLQPVYQRILGSKKGDFPKAENATNKMVCLPMYPQMAREDVNYVVEKIRRFFSCKE